MRRQAAKWHRDSRRKRGFGAERLDRPDEIDDAADVTVM
jgi:hypothetical protein